MKYFFFVAEFSMAIGENLLFTTSMEEAVASLHPKYKKELFSKIEDAKLLFRMRATEGQIRSQTNKF
jgi:hypothetical protein